MPFKMKDGKRRTAIDLSSGAQLTIDSTPDPYQFSVENQFGTETLRTGIRIQQKYPERSITEEGLSNPGIMIPEGNFDVVFRFKGMSDIEKNSTIADKIIRMISFINKNFPLVSASYLWSDYVPGRSLLRIPSDERLLEISVDPEAL